MKWAIPLLFLLGACTQVGAASGLINAQLQQGGEQFRTTMGQAYDRAWAFTCLDAPVSVVRQRNPTPESMKAYEEHCTVLQQPIGPLPPIVTLP